MRLNHLLASVAALGLLSATAASAVQAGGGGVLRGRTDIQSTGAARSAAQRLPATWSRQAAAGNAVTTFARTRGAVVSTGRTPGVTVRRYTQGALASFGQQGFGLTRTQRSIARLRRIAVQVEGPQSLLSPFIGGFGEAFSITVNATGLTEFFALSVPSVPSGQEAPLVVAFHGAFSTYQDITIGYPALIDEAVSRGWFFMAPLQWNGLGPGFDGATHYSSVQSQLHVEEVMDLILDAYPVDLDRIYGVGFSMGGGAALNYAARHRDRSKGAFAAVVNHTGTVALSHVYASSGDARVPPLMDALFGGPPGNAGAAFEYQRSSVIEMTGLGPAGVLDPTGRHMAVNLGAVPVETWYASNDPLTYLQRQSDVFHAFLQGLPGATLVTPRVLNSACGHCWQTLDRVAAYDFLAARRLEIAPDFGTVLADRSGRWGVYDVMQSATGRFSSFNFDVLPGPDSLTLTGVENVETLAVHVDDLGFDGTTPCSFTVETVPAAASTLEISGLSWGPSSTVSHSSVGALPNQTCPATGTVSWCFSGGVLTLHDTTGSPVIWTVTP